MVTARFAVRRCVARILRRISGAGLALLLGLVIDVGLTICEQLEIHEPYVEEPWADGSNADEDPFNTRKL